jgi:hypothetical protein
MDNLPEPFYHGTVLCVAIYILSSLLKLLEILFEVLELLLTMLIEQEIDQ